MAQSFPSNVQSSIDVPEPKRFDAKFVYSFFMPDEKTNDLGLPGAFNESADLFAGIRRPVETKVPRFVEISFEPVTIRSNETSANEFFDDSLRPDDVRELIEDNFSKIQSEVDIAAANTTVVYLQDPDLVDRWDGMFRLMLSIKKYVPSSIAEQAKLINGRTKLRLPGKTIMSVMSASGRKKYLSRDFRAKRLKSAYWRRHRNVRNRLAPDIPMLAHFNSKFVGSISRSITSDAFSPYSESFADFDDQLRSIQRSIEQDSESGTVNVDDLETTMVPFEIISLDSDQQFSSSARVVGYVVDKQELLPDGSIEDREPIILASANVGAAIDSRVKYGGVYTYSIRAIALVQLPAVDQDDNPVIVRSLVSSRASRLDRVRCIEKIPPSSPADIKFLWDYTDKKLMMMWNFPTNPQRDIKRFQVFRRPSIDDPFELLIEYDFDDSEIPAPRSETPRADRVVSISEPMNFFIDHEFGKESSYIYAFCCIDARDLSSNYSEQYRITFDKYKNRIVRDIVSQSGAPKPYPNFYMKGTLTEDCIKDSGHFRLSVFFDPEYLTVVDEKNDDFEFLATDLNGGKYKLQILNIDRQKNKVITFDIKDLR